MDDLRASAAKMKSATTGLTAQTGKAVSALQKIAPSARSERPTSPGGISSTSIHKDIAALGGEPTKPVSGSNQPAKPPQLSASSLKKNPSAGGGTRALCLRPVIHVGKGGAERRLRLP